MIHVQSSEVDTVLTLRVLRGNEEIGRGVDSKSVLITIGRNRYANVRLLDPQVSRIHAAIYRRPGGFLLHNRSPNGTRVNGESAITHVLHDGDVISIGPYEVAVEICQEGPSARHDHGMVEGWTLDDARTLAAV